MKNNFTIFYSWQSDIKSNRNFVQQCIAKAIKELTRKHKAILNLEINLDRDTKNKTGSPAISKTIFDKIDVSDIFICDVSVINKSVFNFFSKNRESPNPNVLIELGYAVHLLGWERIICINNLNYSRTEDLPFDIRGHRISNFNGISKSEKEKLIQTLILAIETIVLNYDKITAAQAKNDHKKHDKEIFHKYTEICSEQILFDSISLAVNSLFTNKYYLDIWDDLSEFYDSTVNYFIDSELDNLIRLFINELNSFNSICSTKFHLKDRSGTGYPAKIMNGDELTEEETFAYKQSQIYTIHKDPFQNETWREADDRVLKVQDQLFVQGEKVKASYRSLVMGVKKNTL